MIQVCVLAVLHRFQSQRNYLISKFTTKRYPEIISAFRHFILCYFLVLSVLTPSVNVIIQTSVIIIHIIFQIKFACITIIISNPDFKSIKIRWFNTCYKLRFFRRPWLKFYFFYCWDFGNINIDYWRIIHPFRIPAHQISSLIQIIAVWRCFFYFNILQFSILKFFPVSYYRFIKKCVIFPQEFHLVNTCFFNLQRIPDHIVCTGTCTIIIWANLNIFISAKS